MADSARPFYHYEEQPTIEPTIRSAQQAHFMHLGNVAAHLERDLYADPRGPHCQAFLRELVRLQAEDGGANALFHNDLNALTMKLHADGILPDFRLNTDEQGRMLLEYSPQTTGDMQPQQSWEPQASSARTDLDWNRRPQISMDVGPPSDTPASQMPPGDTTKTPKPETVSNAEHDRSRFYIDQSKDKEHANELYACGPTSLLMALADYGLAAPTEENRQSLINEQIPSAGKSTADGQIFPGGPGAIAELARNHQLQAIDHSGEASTDAVDKALAAGHSAIINGGVPTSQGIVGHFIYVAGKDENGNYIVGDPIPGSKGTLTQAELASFISTKKMGFTEVWA